MTPRSVVRLSFGRSYRRPAYVARIASRVSMHAARVTALRARVGAIPAWCWPLAVALAAWPVATGVARRLLDGSGDSLGLIALGAFGLVLWQARGRFRGVPRGGHLAIAAALAVASDLSVGVLPEPVRALLACIAVVSGLASIADRDEPIAPYAGLAILSLPLLSSLAIHAGAPLRVVTAEASRWLLTAAGFMVERAGSALIVDGHRVLVDAPCTGVQLTWVGGFAACGVAWIFGLSNRAFLARLPGVAAIVLFVGVARATVLTAADVEGVAMTDAMQAALGVLSISGVAAAVAVLFAHGRPRKAAQVPVRARVVVCGAGCEADA